MLKAWHYCAGKGTMEKNKLRISITILFAALFLIFSVAGGCKTGNTENSGTEEEIGEFQEEEATKKEESTPEVVLISVEKVYEIITSKEDHIILDVRTPEEFKEGHLEGAVLIPVSELEGRLSELPADKPIIVYCKSGSRSSNAANILVKNGFSEVYDMGGGIIKWQDRGYKVVK